MIGTTFGPYRILEKLGAGGMGEVYRARDTRLDRDVAVKVLPPMVAADPERLARFEREAKTLAALNHPNIGHIYGIEDARGTPCLILELVAGEDLAVRVSRGPIALAEALPIARQIAGALEAAHDQGVVHRDLKPANVKVTPDGIVKLLDFGLAKAMDPSASGPLGLVSDASTAMNSPAMTAMGVILGTAAYMAPEQARGRAVDRRADIWAFGVVLFEMLAGCRAFDGDDVSSTLASVLKDEVKWDALPAGLPMPIRRLLRRCLEKDPRRRLSAMGDARLELDDAASGASESADVPANLAGRRQSRAVVIALSALAVVTMALIAALVPAWRYFHPEPDRTQVRFTIDMPPLKPSTQAAWFPSISPDGRTVAYVAPLVAGGADGLWIRSLDSAGARPLAGTEGAVLPFWSPDSQFIAFSARGKLMRIRVAGGEPQPICDLFGNARGTWSRDDVIVFDNPQTGALMRVEANGGAPKDLARPDQQAGEFAYRSPEFLPDGRRLLYFVIRPDTRGAEYVRSLSGGAPVRIAGSDSEAYYASGFLVFERARTLFAQIFDPVSLRLSGQPAALASNVVGSRVRSAFALSTNGVLIYRTGSLADVQSDLEWIDRSGKSLGTVGEVSSYNQMRLSPNEKLVALAEVDGASNESRLSVLDLGSQVTSRLTGETDGPGAGDPLWSPQSDALAFELTKGGKRNFYRQDVGGRDDVPLYESPDDPKWLDDWSADGRYLIFHEPAPARVLAVSLTGNHALVPVLSTSASVDSVHFSHDGRWIAYSVNETGTWETWVASFPNGTHRRQISQHGGGEAWWRGDDREIFYLTPDGKLMSVAVTPDPESGTLTFRTPQALFQSPITAPTMNVDQYSVTRDGQRFLFLRPRAASGAAGPVSAPIQVVLNWTASVTQRGISSPQ